MYLSLSLSLSLSFFWVRSCLLINLIKCLKAKVTNLLGHFLLFESDRRTDIRYRGIGIGIENWDWVTRVSVVKEGKSKKNGLDEVDEAEIFKGDENTLAMTQTYTWEFQCQYKLQHYPFDTQVISVFQLPWQVHSQLLANFESSRPN